MERVSKTFANANSFLYFMDELMLLVDPVSVPEDFPNSLKNKNKKLVTLVTHAHFDHIQGLGLWQEAAPSGDYFMHVNEIRNLKMAPKYSLLLDRKKMPNFEKNKIVMLNGLSGKLVDERIEFILLPGHSDGSVIYIDHKGKKVFSGDSCLKAFVSPNRNQAGYIQRNTEFIKAHFPGYTLYPGHGKISKVESSRCL